MTIRYPNGKVYVPSSLVPRKKTNQSYSNRGMTLEEDINETNKYYLAHNIAVVHKKPTPVQIVNVDYPMRSKAVITEAYFKQASTTDYNGVYKGAYIDFEAKETKNKTSFPLANFHEHQIQHMKHVADHNGIAFVILRFADSNEYYLLEFKYLYHFWENSIKEGKKSIKKKDIEEKGYSIPFGYQPRLDYLKIIDQLYFS